MEKEAYRVEIWRDKQTGMLLVEDWYTVADWKCPFDGQPHRIGGPAKIQRNQQTGVVTDEAWFRNGKYHRDDGPALIIRDPKTGQVIHTLVREHGERIGKPKPPRQPRKRRSQSPSP